MQSIKIPVNPSVVQVLLHCTLFSISKRTSGKTSGLTAFNLLMRKIKFGQTNKPKQVYVGEREKETRKSVKYLMHYIEKSKGKLSSITFRSMLRFLRPNSNIIR